MHATRVSRAAPPPVPKQMRVVIFDLGDTLEHNGVLLPGAREMLIRLKELRGDDGKAPILCLLSNYLMPTDADPLEAIQGRYYALLDTLGIRSFFEPVTERITLSSEVGVGKPAREIFERAIEKVDPRSELHHAIFITENPEHISAARQLGMMAIHFRGPAQQSGEVSELLDLVPLIARLLAFAPCCKKHAEAVGRFASQASKSRRSNPEISTLVSQVDSNRLRSRIAQLTGFGTRWTYSSMVTQVPEWIRGEFLAIGYAPAQVRFQQFTVPAGGQQRNVLCSLGDLRRGIALICAHYDSLSEQPTVSAPGADDNASGIAALLELASILRGIEIRGGILFSAFGGEEQGLFGSGACAEIAAAEKWPIDVVINMDMVAYSDPTNRARVIVEYDQGNRNPENDSAAKAYGLLMAQAAADYTSLEVEHTDIWNSDYMPFEAKGYACIGAYEAGQNPGYHRIADTIDGVDITYLNEIVKMLLATILTIAR